MPNELSLNATARRLKRAKSGLSKLVKAGLIPQLPNGKFDQDAVDKALASNLDPARAKPVTKPVTGNRSGRDRSPIVVPPVATTDDAKAAVALIARVLAEEGVPAEAGAPVDFSMARTADVILKARQRAFAIEVQRKRFIDVEKVRSHVAKAFVGYRQAVQRVPARFAAEIAAEVGCDAAALDGAMTRALTSVLEELSAPAVRG